MRLEQTVAIAMSSRRSIDVLLRERAARWVVRVDADDCSMEEKKQLDAWLAADPSHRVAFDAARAVWLEVSVPALESVRREPSRRSLQWFGVAATLLVTIAAALVTRNEWFDERSIELRADAWTATGESRWMTLDDGSRIQLNTETAVAVDYSGTRRDITLLKGEAAFEVAHDSSRPFRVTTANGDVTALGTVFQVRVDESQAPKVQVVVSQGRVRVRSGVAAAEIAAGEQITYSNEQLGARASVDIKSATAWRRGQLSFIEQPLGGVIAELDRYYRGRIQLASPELASRPVSGVLPVARPLDAIASIERNFGVRARRVGDTLVID